MKERDMDDMRIKTANTGARSNNCFFMEYFTT